MPSLSFSMWNKKVWLILSNCRLTYSDLCFRIPESKFRLCLLKTLAVLFTLMCSYYQILSVQLDTKVYYHIYHCLFLPLESYGLEYIASLAWLFWSFKIIVPYWCSPLWFKCIFSPNLFSWRSFIFLPVLRCIAWFSWVCTFYDFWPFALSPCNLSIILFSFYHL